MRFLLLVVSSFKSDLNQQLLLQDVTREKGGSKNLYSFGMVQIHWDAKYEASIYSQQPPRANKKHLQLYISNIIYPFVFVYLYTRPLPHVIPIKSYRVSAWEQPPKNWTSSTSFLCPRCRVSPKGGRPGSHPITHGLIHFRDGFLKFLMPNFFKQLQLSSEVQEVS